MRRIPETARKLLISDYMSGLTLRQCAENYQCSFETARRIVNDAGVSRKRCPYPRKSQAAPNEPKLVNTCVECGNTAHLKGAKFCAKCGAPLLIRVDAVLEGLGDALQTCLLYLPESRKENTIGNIRAAITLIKEKEEQNHDRH